jgi:branched-chain amino acid transport system ATP-binding protein
VSNSKNIMQVANLNCGYANSQVIHEVSFEVPAQGITAIVGRNGAGKTTLLQTVMGYLKMTSGSLEFSGKQISSLSTSERSRMGMGYVPQERPVFPNLTVDENLIIGASSSHRSKRNQLDSAFELFPKLAARRNQKVGTMSGGERKMVGIARALLGNPSLLIMDEPTEGVWHGVVDEIREHLITYSQDHAVLIVEQNLDFLLDISSVILLLERGMISKRITEKNQQEADEIRKRLTI